MPSAIRASEAIKKRITDHIWNQGDRLPPLAELARSCSVSRATMWRAIGLLRKDSVVHVVKGKAIVVGREPDWSDPHDGPNVSGFAWEQLKAKIGSEILAGLFTENRLPPMNKMTLSYGVALNTLKKSLAALVQEGLLVREGNHHAVARSRRRRHAPAIVLLSAGDHQNGIITSHIRTHQIVESVERECLRLGYTSWSEGFDYQNAIGLVKTSEAIKQISNIAGFVVNIWNPYNESHWGRWIGLLRFLIGRNVPIVAIDQDGDTKFPEEVLASAMFRVLRIAGTRSGELAADFLLSRGHRQFAFLTSFAGASWANKRYTGLANHVRNYGGPRASVEFYSTSEVVDLEDLTLSALSLDKNQIRALYGGKLTRDQMAETMKRIDRIDERGLGRKTSQGPGARAIAPMAKQLASIAERAPDPFAYDQMLERLLQIASIDASKSFLRPLFQHVFDSFKGSVWVCSDDNTAVYALSFLAEKNVAIPKNLSVMGFDNWDEAYRHQLTTFDFNMFGMVQQAMQLIASERYLKSKPVISEVDGYVVERKSTLRLRSVQALRTRSSVQAKQ